MTSEKDFAGRQHRGRRKRQEDAYAFSDIPSADGETEGLFVVVADGMGGHTSGEQASELALDTFVDAFHLGVGQVTSRFTSAVVAANEAIARELKETPT